ncbi:glycosyl hydrolase [Nocardia macrotermitis]|uniref:Alpha-L-rhamnosidase n=1 Tax=Nocardia macrotermitis TaxID=2585198 RepID=A0A7K0D7D7_9NOCA|nr:glycosyl hydrolase [Nocardia macrotermitis]MQY21618.1 hypothetical protein [Nocardia macrotermitis]
MAVAPSRRRFLQSIGAVVAAGALGGAVTSSCAVESGTGVPEWLREPAASMRPRFRWWWPGAMVEDAQIAAEVEAMAAAGFGGFEIGDVWDSVSGVGAESIDPVRYGWGTPRWHAAVATALKTAKQHGLTADLTIGPHWPSAIPGLTPDGVGSAKEIVAGAVEVAGGAVFDAAVPEPATPPSGVTEGNPAPPVTAVLHALLAARLQPGSAVGGRVVGLVADSVTDLTTTVRDGRISWTAPDGSAWALIAIWTRGTGQIVNAYDTKSSAASPMTTPQAYVVDHFGPDGAQAVIDYWGRNLLPDPILDLLRDVGGSIFEDSLELKAVVYWTPNMPREFAERRGYDLTRYLPLIAGTGFSYDDATTTRVRHDYDQTISDLYLDNRVDKLKQWCESLGLRFRNQPYGAPLDSTLAAARTDIPEGESLAFSDLDRFRTLAGGRDLGGRAILSDEAGAFLNGAYNTTWKQLITTLNSNYAAGVNQVMIHGFAYADAPGAQWPGFAAFSPLFGGTISFAEAWGPRQPSWVHAPDVSTYLGRLQAVLRAGSPRVDVAVYRQEFNASAGALTGSAVGFFDDPGLRRAGYTYQFLSHGALTLPRARVSDGRLAADGPGYRALILNDQATMPLATANTLLVFARRGLHIVVVGRAPGSTPGYRDARSEDEQLSRVIAELLAERTVVRVSMQGDVPAALTRVGILPDVRPDGSTELLSVHRVDGDSHYYYLYNAGSAAIDQSISLQGNSIGYQLNPWTGAASTVSDARGSDNLEVRIRLEPAETTVIVLGAVVGGTLRDPIDRGEPLTLESWTLRVEDWRPGPTATRTAKTEHTVHLDRLTPWSKITGLEDVSGIGTYTTTFEVPAEFTRTGATQLNLGEMFDTARVSLNGQQLPPVDVFHPVADLGDRLRTGENTITVQVASTLNNRLRISRPELFGSRERQDYGLLGPVHITSYTSGTPHPRPSGA